MRFAQCPAVPSNLRDRPLLRTRFRGETAAYERSVGPDGPVRDGDLAKDVVGIKISSCPSNIAEDDYETTLLESDMLHHNTADLPSELRAWNAICWQRRVAQEAVFPPPVSLFKAWRALQRSHWVSGRQTSSMLLVTHSLNCTNISVILGDQ